VGHVARMGVESVQCSSGKARRKRPLGRPRPRWEGGIRIDLRETGWGSVEWIQLAQNRGRWRNIMNMANEPAGSSATELQLFFTCRTEKFQQNYRRLSWNSLMGNQHKVEALVFSNPALYSGGIVFKTWTRDRLS
jgi:hypothetical protein